MYQKIRKGRGITLIALVITILILVILAGVTIATLKNTNLFNSAIKAKEKSDYASAKEAIELKLSAINADYEMHGNGEAKLQFTAEKLDNDDDIDYVRAEYEEEASIKGLKKGQKITKIYTKLRKYKDYEFGISDNIEIATINGKAVSENNKITLTGSISFEKDLLKPSETTTATITVKDNESEINYANSKYILTNSATNIGTNDETKYSGGTLSSTGTASVTAGSTEGDYYLHVLLKDNAGNKSEIVSEKLEVSAITYLYNNNEDATLNQYTDITGGFKDIVQSGYCKCTYNNTNIYMHTTSRTYSLSCITTNKLIDLSKYNKIYFKVKNTSDLSSGYIAKVGIGTDNTSWYPAFNKCVITDVSQDIKTYSVDISDINGEYYPAISGVMELYVYSIWLE